ncbi:MAG: twin-arginine translocase TatA/TatE family subunit [Actinomycetota bacterium]|nr:twin-arginine translocase TatA/TatE family subunit [Actinomycetota bacterium]
MLDLSPTKLLIIFVVVVVILGPKRLPEVARQLGAGWRKVRELHTRLDSEIRQAVPDLPSSQDIVRFARSPVSLLNQLADVHGEPPSPNGDGHAGGDGHGGGDGHAGAGDGHAGGAGTSPRMNGTRGAAEPGTGRAEQTGAAEPGTAAAHLVAPALARLDTDDPNLN